jgi:hypothetical protein
MHNSYRSCAILTRPATITLAHVDVVAEPVPATHAGNIVVIDPETVPIFTVRPIVIRAITPTRVGELTVADTLRRPCVPPFSPAVAVARASQWATDTAARVMHRTVGS